MALGGVEVERLAAVDGQDEGRGRGGGAVGLGDEAGEEAVGERDAGRAGVGLRDGVVLRVEAVRSARCIIEASERRGRELQGGKRSARVRFLRHLLYRRLQEFASTDRWVELKLDQVAGVREDGGGVVRKLAVRAHGDAVGAVLRPCRSSGE